MIDAMLLHEFSKRTQDSYLAAVKQLARVNGVNINGVKAL
jgi:hypothetical protein